MSRAPEYPLQRADASELPGAAPQILATWAGNPHAHREMSSSFAGVKVVTTDFQQWFQASQQWAMIYEAFLRSQQEYMRACEAVRLGDIGARRNLVNAAVGLRAAQIELMHFTLHRQRRPAAPDVTG
jgi:hypothetical protein